MRPWGSAEAYIITRAQFCPALRCKHFPHREHRALRHDHSTFDHYTCIKLLNRLQVCPRVLEQPISDCAKEYMLIRQ